MIKDLRSNGTKWGKIADLLDIPEPTLRRWAQENGLAKVRDHVAPILTTDDLPSEPTFEELIQLARDSQKAMNGVDPILTYKTIPIPTEDTIGIIFASCIHLGSRYVKHEEFAALLEQILETPGIYFFDLGDQVEGMEGFFDVGSASEQSLPSPLLQRKLLAHVLDKLADSNKLLCGFAGQHGAQWQDRKSGVDPIKQMYLARGIPYFDGQAYITVEVGSQSYEIFAGHQLPGHSQWNKHHAHRRASVFRAPTADIVVQGDRHQGGVQWITNDSWSPRSPEIQWFVQAGTAKTGPDPYTIGKWKVGTWEYPILLFRADRHEVGQARDLSQAQALLEGWE